MYRDLIEAPEQIRVNGIDWWIQQFNGWDGNLRSVMLYTEDGDYIGEFDSMESLVEFVAGIKNVQR